jgi:hypothetical protein
MHEGDSTGAGEISQVEDRKFVFLLHITHLFR